MCIAVFVLHYLVLNSKCFQYIWYKLRGCWLSLVMLMVQFKPRKELDLDFEGFSMSWTWTTYNFINLWGGYLQEAKLYSVLITIVS